MKLPRKHTLNGGKSRARKHTFCSCFFCVCFFFAHNIRIIPVQASRQKSDGKVFPTFFHFSEDLKNWDFNPGGTTITIKQNTNANYYSGRQFEIFDKNCVQKITYKLNQKKLCSINFLTNTVIVDRFAYSSRWRLTRKP